MTEKPFIYYSEEGLVLYSAMFEALFKDSSLLEKIIKDLPEEVNFIRDESSAFQLRNKNSGFRIDTNRSEFSFWLSKIYPVFGINGKFHLEDNNCSFRTTCFGFSGQFEEPSFYSGTACTTSIYLYRNKESPYLPRGKEEWFLQADKLMKRAAEKYHLNNWYDLFKNGADGHLTITGEGGKLTLMDSLK